MHAWLLIPVSHHKTSVHVLVNFKLAEVKKDVCNQLNWLLKEKRNTMHVLFYLSLPCLYSNIVEFTNLYWQTATLINLVTCWVMQVKSSRAIWQSVVKSRRTTLELNRALVLTL